MSNAKNNRAGFSVVEVILATALAGMFVTAVAGGLVFGLRAAKEAGRKNQAILFAEEGIAAVQNIRDASYANLTDGTWGLSTAGNQWGLSGASDTTGIYTRTQTIATVDAMKKSNTSTVTWREATGTTRSVSLVTYFSNWNETTTLLGGGLVFGNGTTDPTFRSYNTTTNTFDTTASTAVGSAGVSFRTRASPTKTEMITGYVTHIHQLGSTHHFPLTNIGTSTMLIHKCNSLFIGYTFEILGLHFIHHPVC